MNPREVRDIALSMLVIAIAFAWPGFPLPPLYWIAISTLLAKSGTTKARTTKNKIASKIFTRGPAIEIIPFCLLFISPAI